MAIRTTNITEGQSGFEVEMMLAPPGSDLETTLDFLRFRVSAANADRFPRLADVQLVALQRAQAIIDTEIGILKLAKGRNP